MPRTALNFIAPVVRQCIDECVRCHEVCLSTIPYCLEQGGEHAEEAHIVLLQDCAEICRTNVDFMLRGSDEQERISAACAAICRHCADDCDRLSDDDVMRACAEACRRCAESCERMAHRGGMRARRARRAVLSSGQLICTFLASSAPPASARGSSPRARRP